MKLDGNGLASGTFTSSAAYVDLTGQEAPITVSVYPGSGCVCAVEVCNVAGAADSPPADGYWEAWQSGSVSAAKSDQLNTRFAAVRFRRVSGSTTCEFTVRGGEKA